MKYCRSLEWNLVLLVLVQISECSFNTALSGYRGEPGAG